MALTPLYVKTRVQAASCWQSYRMPSYRRIPSP